LAVWNTEYESQKKTPAYLWRKDTGDLEEKKIEWKEVRAISRDRERFKAIRKTSAPTGRRGLMK
jgi:hypothetical protein